MNVEIALVWFSVGFMVIGFGYMIFALLDIRILTPSKYYCGFCETWKHKSKIFKSSTNIAPSYYICKSCAPKPWVVKHRGSFLVFADDLNSFEKIDIDGTEENHTQNKYAFSHTEGMYDICKRVNSE